LRERSLGLAEKAIIGGVKLGKRFTLSDAEGGKVKGNRGGKREIFSLFHEISLHREGRRNY
jgi:hypothetical protein